MTPLASMRDVGSQPSGATVGRAQLISPWNGGTCVCRGGVFSHAIDTDRSD